MTMFKPIIPIDLTPAPCTIWNWDKPSKAVLAVGKCGTTIIMHGAGPVFAEYSPEVSNYAADLDLDLSDENEGIYIWEGKLHSSKYMTDCGMEYDSELIGDIREPTEEEWQFIMQGDCPWTHRDWLRNPCEMPDCENPAEGGYPVCEECREEIEKG